MMISITMPWKTLTGYETSGMKNEIGDMKEIRAILPHRISELGWMGGWMEGGFPLLVKIGGSSCKIKPVNTVPIQGNYTQN